MNIRGGSELSGKIYDFPNKLIPMNIGIWEYLRIPSPFTVKKHSKNTYFRKFRSFDLSFIYTLEWTISSSHKISEITRMTSPEYFNHDYDRIFLMNVDFQEHRFSG